jgi:hypothetical protein
MDQSHIFHCQQKRSFVVIAALLFAAFCLGSLLTSVQMSQTVAQYLVTSPSPTAMAHFNFLDDLAIYPLLALAGLVGLTLLAFMGMIVQGVRTLINRTSTPR